MVEHRRASRHGRGQVWALRGFAALLLLLCWPLASGCSEGSLASSPLSAPEVLRFFAEPALVAPGEQVLLRWELSGVSSATITSQGGIIEKTLSGGELEAGELRLRPVQSARYVLEAQRRTRSGGVEIATAAVDVQVQQPASRPALSLSADALRVQRGASVVLRWTSAGATSLRLEANGALVELGGQSLTGGELMLRPEVDTRYVMTATGPGGQTQEQLTVEVQSPPTVVLFEADASRLSEGEGTLLRWEVLGAESVAILAGSTPLSLEGLSPQLGALGVQPEVTTTYLLQARNADGETVREATVEVQARPRILALSVDPAEVRPGESSRISWVVEGAERLTLSADGAPVPLPSGALETGVVLVRPPTTTTYRLVAEAAGGSAEQSRVVSVFDRTVIHRFEASPTRIGPGEGAELSWETTGATEVTITGPDGESLGVEPGSVDGTVRVSPPQTARYRLTANGPAGLALADVQVVVDAAPAILSFTASPEAVSVGGEAMLSWQAVNVDAVTLEAEPGGPVDLWEQPARAGAVVVEPEETTIYHLRGRGPRGQVEAQVTLQVFREVAITRFEAVPPILDPGAPATLEWSTLNAASATLSWEGGEALEVEPEGSLQLPPLASTTVFTLRAEGIGGPAVATARIEVGVPPRVLGFTLEPRVAAAGSPRTLRWESVGAARATILVDDGTGEPAPLSAGALDPAGGSWVVAPTRPTRYTLVVANATAAITAEAEAELTAPPVDPRLDTLLISEIGGIGAETAAPWVELVNAGAAPLELDGVSLEAGAEGVSARALPLSGTLLPGRALLLSEGVAALLGDALAGLSLSLRAEAPAEVRWSRVLLGGDGEDGADDGDDGAQSEGAAPLPGVGESAQRFPGVSSTGWVLASRPTPGRAFGLAPRRGYAPELGRTRDPRVLAGRLSGPEAGGERLVLAAWIPQGAVSEVWLGDQRASCAILPDRIDCAVPAGTGVVSVALRGADGAVEEPELYSYEASAGCALLTPLALGVGLGGDEIAGEQVTFFGAVADVGAVEASWGYGPVGTDPLYAGEAWTWYAAGLLEGNVPGERLLSAEVALPAAEASYVFRVRPVGTVPWTYCDSDGTYNASAAPRNLFDPAATGLLNTYD
jgi:hypothetical protein